MRFDRPGTNYFAIFAVLLASCGDQSTNANGVIDELRPFADAQSSSQSEANLLRNSLQRNFDRATRSASPQRSRITAMPANNSAGLSCVPARLDKDTPTFSIELPVRETDRYGTLAAISPDGSLHEIYNSYYDLNSEDLIIPSRALSWEKAKKGYRFAIDTRTFDALKPNEDKSQKLFVDEGVYQFALINANSTGRANLGDEPFWVIAGCLVYWRP